jgi:hypothetical protein
VNILIRPGWPGSRFDRERRWVKFCSWKTAPGHSPLLEQLCGLLSELHSRQSRCCDVPQIIYGQRANRDVAPEGTASVSVLLFCACWSSLPTTQPWRPALRSYRIASSHLKPRVGREYLPAKTPPLFVLETETPTSRIRFMTESAARPFTLKVRIQSESTGGVF